MNAELRYRFQKNWHLIAGALYEDYEVQDPAATGTTFYLPTALFTAANDGDYEGKVLYLRAAYEC